ncbi:MAG: hypothetical protein JWR21_1797 [Herminiimonas sp.]|nr:hypothetical protein [Herminiimonas sp.]
MKGYHRQFLDQISKQVVRANDPWFCNSYISGFSFAELPAMRETASIWHEFVDSIGDALAHEVTRKGAHHLLAKTLCRCSVVEAGCDSSEVIEAINAHWETYGRDIRGFYHADAQRSATLKLVGRRQMALTNCSSRADVLTDGLWRFTPGACRPFTAVGAALGQWPLARRSGHSRCGLDRQLAASSVLFDTSDEADGRFDVKFVRTGV